MTANEIIQGLGGNTAVHRFTGWPISTITSMRRFNSVPEWRRSKLLEMAGCVQFALAATDFPLKDDRIGLERQAA